MSGNGVPAEYRANKYHEFAQKLNDCVYFLHKVISLWATYRVIIVVDGDED